MKSLVISTLIFCLFQVVSKADSREEILAEKIVTATLLNTVFIPEDSSTPGKALEACAAITDLSKSLVNNLGYEVQTNIVIPPSNGDSELLQKLLSARKIKGEILSQLNYAEHRLFTVFDESYKSQKGNVFSCKVYLSHPDFDGPL